MSLNEKLTALANSIRTKSGASGLLSLDAMKTAVDSIQTGGGGSLPSVISKLDGGSFTLPSDTLSNNYTISHNLGVAPTGFVVYAAENLVTPTVARVVNKMLYEGDNGVLKQLLSTGGARFDGLASAAVITSSTDLKISVAQNYYEGGCTYRWLVWA